MTGASRPACTSSGTAIAPAPCCGSFGRAPALRRFVVQEGRDSPRPRSGRGAARRLGRQRARRHPDTTACGRRSPSDRRWRASCTPRRIWCGSLVPADLVRPHGAAEFESRWRPSGTSAAPRDVPRRDRDAGERSSKGRCGMIERPVMCVRVSQPPAARHAPPGRSHRDRTRSGQRRRLFERDYQTPSPFNTYLIDGLPPGPIGVPSESEPPRGPLSGTHPVPLLRRAVRRPARVLAHLRRAPGGHPGDPLAPPSRPAAYPGPCASMTSRSDWAARRTSPAAKTARLTATPCAPAARTSATFSTPMPPMAIVVIPSVPGPRARGTGRGRSACRHRASCRSRTVLRCPSSRPRPPRRGGLGLVPDGHADLQSITPQTRARPRGMSPVPTCTPHAPTASATSARSLTQTGIASAARSAIATSRSVAAGTSLMRSCTAVTPPRPPPGRAPRGPGRRPGRRR